MAYTCTVDKTYFSFVLTVREQRISSIEKEYEVEIISVVQSLLLGFEGI